MRGHATSQRKVGSRIRLVVWLAMVGLSWPVLGAERLLGTNRLLLRPGEGWHDPPPGEFSFWLARQELPTVVPPAVVTAAMLGQAVQGLLALIDAAAAAGLPLSLAADRVALLADGRDRKSTRLNSSHVTVSRMPSSA